MKVETSSKQTERHVKTISQMQTANNNAVTEQFFKKITQTLETFKVLLLISINLTLIQTNYLYSKPCNIRKKPSSY